VRRTVSQGPSIDRLREQHAGIDAKIDALVDNLDPRNVVLLDAKLTELREQREVCWSSDPCALADGP
jgi:hypothetical protein